MAVIQPMLFLAAFFLPNPNHPLAPDAIRAWLTPRPDAYFENVASLVFVALATIAVASRSGWRIPRLWGGFALIFGVFALGPFVHVAGINTHVPGPWSLLRYVPVIGLARTPSRLRVREPRATLTPEWVGSPSSGSTETSTTG